MILEFVKEDLLALSAVNHALPDGVRLSDPDLEDLKSGNLYLGLVAKAKRALAFIEIVKHTGQEDTDKVTPKALTYLVTRAEIEPIEDTLEGTGQILLGIYTLLKQKGIIEEGELQKVLTDLADGKIEGGSVYA